ncbi:hypothetical protein GCM10010409_05710 [Mycolicibacterium diernhoferi]
MGDRQRHVVAEVDERLEGLDPPGLKAERNDAHTPLTSLNVVLPAMEQAAPPRYDIAKLADYLRLS